MNVFVLCVTVSVELIRCDGVRLLSLNYLEGQFILFPAPDQQAWIISAQTEEIFSVHGYQAAGMDWGGVGSGEILLAGVALPTPSLDFFVEKAPLPDTGGFLLLGVHGPVGKRGVI